MAHRVRVFQTRIASLFQVGGDAHDWNLQQARRISRTATILAPRGRTGGLSRSHRVVQARDRIGRFRTGFRVENTARHAAFVALGTGIHGPARRVIVYRKPAGPIMEKRGIRNPRFIRRSRGQRPNDWLNRAARMVLRIR